MKHILIALAISIFASACSSTGSNAEESSQRITDLQTQIEELNIQLEEKVKEETPVSSDETVITPTTTFSAETNNENSSEADSIEIVESDTIETSTDSFEFETIPLEDRDVLLDAFFQVREEIFAGNLFFADCAERILGERALELIGEAVVDGGRFDWAEGILGERALELIDRSPTNNELLLLEGCLDEAQRLDHERHEDHEDHEDHEGHEGHEREEIVEDGLNDQVKTQEENEETQIEKTEEVLQGNLASFEGLWKSPEVEWIEFDFNTEYILCDDPDGYCVGWAKEATQDCKDNYLFKRNPTQEEQEKIWKYERCVEQMVFKPFNPLVVDRTASTLTSGQKDEGERLKQAGWNEETDTEITFRVASDIPEEIVEASKDGMYKAIELLGQYGPLRVYYVGNDVNVIDDLIQDFCDFNYPDRNPEYCQNDQGQGMREMAYIYPGGNGFAQHSWHSDPPVQSFVHNPSAGESNEFLYETNFDRIVNAHEYFHIYQNAHKVYRGHDQGFGWDTSRWVEEGSAVYFETYLGDQLGWINRNQRLLETLSTIASFHNRFPGLSIKDVDTEEQVRRVSHYCFEVCIGNLQYELGHIAFELLAKRTSPEAIIFDFWDHFTEEGWVKAFETAFSITVEGFYEEYEEFLKRSIEEQFDVLTG